jgi:hypothetical protein
MIFQCVDMCSHECRLRPERRSIRLLRLYLADPLSTDDQPSCVKRSACPSPAVCNGKNDFNTTAHDSIWYLLHAMLHGRPVMFQE